MPYITIDQEIEMNERSFEDYTEIEFLRFLKKICAADYASESAHDSAILEFERVSEHPDGSDLIYYPRGMKTDTPEGIVDKIKVWRAKNGKPGFKSE